MNIVLTNIGNHVRNVNPEHNRVFYHHFTLTQCMASFDFLAVTISILGLAASITYYANILQSTEKAKRRDLILQRY